MPKRQPHRLYFGYGSNLDPVDWARYCARHGHRPEVIQPVGPATLPGETLVFDYYSDTRTCGALNIRADADECVDGYLFAVTPPGWDILDRKEGHPHRYLREVVRVTLAEGESVEAHTYRVIDSMRRPFTAPNDGYLDACRAGRQHYGISTDQLERAAGGDLAEFIISRAPASQVRPSTSPA